MIRKLRMNERTGHHGYAVGLADRQAGRPPFIKRKRDSIDLMETHQEIEELCGRMLMIGSVAAWRAGYELGYAGVGDA